MAILRILIPGIALIATWSLAVKATAVELNPQQIYERAAPGVVLIIGHPEDGQLGSGGTGSIIRKDGLILTNAHVVIEEKTGKPYPRLFVFLKPARVTGNPQTDLSRKVKATTVGFNRSLDLALLRMETPPALLTTLVMSDPDQVRIGDRVAAIGHPEQGGLWTLTTGVVSAEFVDFNNTKGKDVFQTETGLNRGNSGGPLLDPQGQIVGVNTSIARRALDGLPITSISFAIKSSVARTWLGEQGVMLEYVTLPVAPAKEVAPLPAAPTLVLPQAPSPPDPMSPAPKALPPKGVFPPQPEMHTDPRPYNMDQLITGFRKTQVDMENLADEMRKRIHQR